MSLVLTLCPPVVGVDMDLSSQREFVNDTQVRETVYFRVSSLKNSRRRPDRKSHSMVSQQSSSTVKRHGDRSSAVSFEAATQ